VSYKIVYSHDVGHWVASKTNGMYSEDQSTAIGLERDGSVVAGVIYENWNGKSVVCHIAVSARITRQYLACIFEYAFNVLNVWKIIAPVYSDNTQARKLVANMGFSDECVIQDASPNGDIVCCTMTKKNCKFLGARYGKIR